MTHALEFKAIRALLDAACDGNASVDVRHNAFATAIQTLANVVEAIERGHVHDTEPPPPHELDKR